VDRLRNGRSFVTREVVARQAGGAILDLSCSFQVDEDEADVQVGGLPDVDLPRAAREDDSWGPLIERQWGQRPGPGVARTWLRVRGPLGEDPILHQCALAFASDDAPMEAALTHHPRWSGREEDFGRFMTASLDHAIWFHRPPVADEWHIHDFTAHGYLSSRGLGIGHILSRDGTHIATVAQEVLLRRSR
jgi:acyl-CoA thioesterase II